MPTTIHEAVLVAQADARSGIGGVADARLPCLALGRFERHLDRDRAAVGAIALWAHLDALEVARIAELAVERGNRTCIVGLTLVQSGEPVHEILVETLFAEAQRTETVARTAVRGEQHLGLRTLGVDAQLAAGEREVEVAALGRELAQPFLDGLVVGVVERRPDGQGQIGDDLGELGVVARLARDVDVACRDRRTCAERDFDCRVPAFRIAPQVLVDLGSVITECVQRRPEIVFGAAEQALHLP